MYSDSNNKKINMKKNERNAGRKTKYGCRTSVLRILVPEYLKEEVKKEIEDFIIKKLDKS